MFELRASPATSLGDQLAFFSSLSTVVRSGMPITVGLEHVKEGVRGAQKAKVAEIIRLITDKGRPFHEAMRTTMSDLPPLYLALIEQGEGSGRLEKAVEEVARLCQRRVEVRNQILSGLAYPAFILVLSILLLPAASLFTEGTAAYLTKVTPGLIFLGGVAVYFLFFHPRLYLGDTAAMTRDRMLLAIPFVAGLCRRLALARFSQAMGSLVESGMALTRGLPLAAASSGNRYFQLRMLRVADRVEKGTPLSEALSAAPELFTPAFVAMTRTGETTGELERTLESMGKLQEAEARSVIDTLLKLAGPMVTLVVMLFVAWQVIGFYTARFEAIGNLM